MITLFRISSASLSFLISACCWAIVPLHVSTDTFKDFSSGSLVGMLEDFCLLLLFGNFTAVAATLSVGGVNSGASGLAPGPGPGPSAWEMSGSAVRVAALGAECLTEGALLVAEEDEEQC